MYQEYDTHDQKGSASEHGTDHVAPADRLPSYARHSTQAALFGRPVGWLAAVLLIVLGVGYVYLTFPADGSPTNAAPVAAASLATSTAMPNATQTSGELALAQEATATPTPTSTDAPSPQSPTATSTLAPDQRETILVPRPNAVGWVSSRDRPFNNLGGRSLHAGRFEGNTYYGVLQFQLGSIPVGTEIEGATLELVGLSAENLAPGGTWQLHLLAPDLDEDWTSISFEAIDTAEPLATIPPELTSEDLGVRRTSVFSFTPEQLRYIEERLESGLISFRIDGPTDGPDNLFTWYTGVESTRRPFLRIVHEQPPETTPMVVVNTPTPENVVTAAAVARTATAQVETTGTPTPLPLRYVTATPPVIVTNTPTPETAATAEMLVAEATARAFLFGTPTPMVNVWTATPVPPTAEPTSTPTSTPLPLLMSIEQVLALTPTGSPTPAPTPTPATMPASLAGRIAFLSDRLGDEKTFVVDANGGNMALLTDRWAYDRAKFLDGFSPDGNQRAFVNDDGIWVQEANGFTEFLAGPGTVSYDPAWSPDGVHIAFVSQVNGNDEIFVVNRRTKEVEQLTSNQWEWDKHPSWSPDGSQIVFWSNRVTGRPQLWIMNADGSNQRPLFQNEWSNSDPVWLK